MRRIDDWLIDNFFQDLSDWLTDITMRDCYQWAEALLLIEALFEAIEFCFMSERSTGKTAIVFIWVFILVPFLVFLYRKDARRHEGTMPEMRSAFWGTRIFIGVATIFWACFMIYPAPSTAMHLIQNMLVLLSLYLGACSRKTPEPELKFAKAHT